MEYTFMIEHGVLFPKMSPHSEIAKYKALGTWCLRQVKKFV